SSSLSDVTLIIGEKRLYVNKQYLSIISNGFRAMFDEEPSGTKNEFKLEGVEYQEAIELLNWIYPSFTKNFDEDHIVARLVEMANRFDIKSINDQIENYLRREPAYAHFALRMVLHFAHGID
ncbi:hypothetical protein PENTCL1PPCAC_23822, partial [Pristionchus entomophagus]